MPHYVFFVFHFWRVTTKSGSHGVGRRGEKNQASSVVVATASSLRKLPIEPVCSTGRVDIWKIQNLS